MGHKAFLLLWLLIVFSSACLGAGDSTNVKAVINSAHRSFPSLLLPTSPRSWSPVLPPGPIVSEDERQLRNQIESTFLRVTEENRLIDFLDNSTLVELPVGVKTDAGLFEHVVLIDSIVMTPRGSFLYASMLFKTPYGNLHFVGADIEVSKAGGVSRAGKLFLVGDYGLDIGNMVLSLSGNRRGTFIEFDCNGYKQLSLTADVIFPTSMLVPSKENNSYVHGQFTTSVTDWNDVIAEISIDPFKLAGFEDFTFEIKSAVVDLSDTRNPPNIKLPVDYQSVYHSPQLWRGLYLREASVTLPENLDSQHAALAINAFDLIIDERGLTGSVGASHLLSLDRGKISNWNFSIDELRLHVIANRPDQCSFKGRVLLPICKSDEEKSVDKSALRYVASVNGPGQYLFNVVTTDTIQFPLWRSNVQLEPSSAIEVRMTNGKLSPKAVLHGTMKMALADDGSMDATKFVSLPRMTFRNLVIEDEMPFLKFGLFSFENSKEKSALGGFPVKVNSIGATTEGNNVRFFIDLSIGLTEEKDGGIASAGRIAVVSSARGTNNERYAFDRIELGRFSVAIDRGPFKFNGLLDFYKNDEVYGNGIRGEIDAKFQPGIAVRATALFGNRNGMRYWYADALVAPKTGIQIMPPLYLTSLGGGMYYHMKMSSAPVVTAQGKTKSGVSYVPDDKTLMGFKAVAHLGVLPGKKTFSGQAILSMEFNSHGGLKHIGFNGKAYFLTNPLPIDIEKIKQLTKNLPGLPESPADASRKIFGSTAPTAPLYGDVNLTVDFERNIIHGNLSVYLNVGKGLIKGSGADNKAGEAVMHFSPSSWYIYVGEPEDSKRIGLTVAKLASMKSYFVMGSSIPPSPPPPARFSKIIGDIDLDYTNDLNHLSQGSGVGFGSSFSVNTGDVKFLAFYGKFSADLGFDVMLRDYEDSRCDDGSLLGIDGWYANGQAYAYFEGQVGIKVKVMRRTRRIPILEIGAAAVAQAKLPNPSWFRGTVGGYFNVLGGLVKGTCRFQVEIGKSCVMDPANKESELDMLQVVSSVTPADNSTQVDVFTTPQVVFNYEVGKEFEYINDAGVAAPFRIVMDDFHAVANGSQVDAKVTWNSDKTVALLSPLEILPSRSKVTVNVSASVQEKQDGQWVTSLSDGKPIQEIHTTTFETGVAPDYIPPSNVEFSYPEKNQLNFYSREYSNGFVQLKQGQQYLFSSSDFQLTARFRASDGQQVSAPLTYGKDRRLTFEIPSLKLQEIYAMEFVLVPVKINSGVDSNVSTEMIVASSDVGDIQVRQKKATTSLRQLRENLVYQSVFRTSVYPTFLEKIRSISMSSGWRDPIYPNVHAIGVNIDGSEPFSLEEIVGIDGKPALITFEAKIETAKWFTDEIRPLLYENYPLAGTIHVTNRDTEILGVVPSKAVFLYQHPHELQISSADHATGKFSFPPTVGRVDYMLAYYMYNDFMDLSNQAAIYASRFGRTSAIDKLLSARFPYIKQGSYSIEIGYVLPGADKPLSKTQFTIINPIE